MDKYGEGLYGDEARRALVQACKETGSHVMDFHIAPMDLDEETMPRHQWLIEFEGPSPDLERFSDCLDKLIQSINRHYTIRREAGAFLKPVVIPLREGTFYDWFLERGKQVSAQSKVPRMSTDSEIATELLSISRNNTFSNRDAVSNSLNAGT